MRQDNHIGRREIISLEEYLKKRKLIREKERANESGAIRSGQEQGAVMELAEWMYM